MSDQGLVCEIGGPGGSTRALIILESHVIRVLPACGRYSDFLLSEHRDIATAKRFFAQAIEKCGVPEKITLDGYAASHAAVAELQTEDVLPMTLTVRKNKYLNSTTPLSSLG